MKIKIIGIVVIGGVMSVQAMDKDSGASYIVGYHIIQLMRHKKKELSNKPDITDKIIGESPADALPRTWSSSHVRIRVVPRPRFLKPCL